MPSTLKPAVMENIRRKNGPSAHMRCDSAFQMPVKQTNKHIEYGASGFSATCPLIIKESAHLSLPIKVQESSIIYHPGGKLELKAYNLAYKLSNGEIVIKRIGSQGFHQSKIPVVTRAGNGEWFFCTLHKVESCVDVIAIFAPGVKVPKRLHLVCASTTVSRFFPPKHPVASGR